MKKLAHTSDKFGDRALLCLLVAYTFIGTVVPISAGLLFMRFVAEAA